jgi:hypothetical protein
MVNDLRVTEILEIAGVADYTFCSEEGKWKGSEVHRATELLDRGRLRLTPQHVRGQIQAYTSFKVDCHFVPDPDGIEIECRNKTLGIRGRADRLGKRKGNRCVVDIKAGRIQPAAILQLTLYGEAIDPGIWWDRIAVELREDGTYRAYKCFRETYGSDLITAHAAVRLARWKIQNGVYRKAGA